ncbi:MAG: hypothetical protein IJ705_02925 [Oscillospiraceae bacterium]|nr:hypothetical protein [Oscillospiraceae bacterium]
MSGPALVYFHAARAGLTRRETAALPIGQVYDQIAAWLIEERGYRPRSKPRKRDVFDF